MIYMQKNIYPRLARKIFIVFFTVIAVSALFAVAASGLDNPTIDRYKAACVYNIDNEKKLFSSGGDNSLAPASTVKLMTAVVALDYYTNAGALDKEITVTSAMLRDVTGNNIGLHTGEVVTARQLISSLVVGGSNDAAYVLAADSYGSTEAFVAAMNARAGELGMKGTYYTNPTGIDSDAMRTTLEDTLTIALEAYRHNLYMELAGLTRYVMDATNKSEVRYIYNRNYLIATNSVTDYYYEDATGMSSGMTENGGWCLVATAHADGVTQLVIVMGGERDENADGTYGDISSYVDALALFKWAFDNFSYVRVLENTTMICEIPVNLGRGVDHVTLLPETSLELYLPTDINVSKEITLSWALNKPSLTAPVKAGDVAGLLTLSYKDEVVGRVNLVVKNNVELYRALQFLNSFRGILETELFRTAAVAAAVTAFIYIIIVAVIRGRRRKKRYYRK
jgi:D-alanyl-D-alanine carboxypeptidase